MAHPQLLRSFGTLADAEYRRGWAIGALTGGARWLEFVAIAIYAYELTHSPQLVALLSVLRMAPYVMLGLLIGGLADIYDRRLLLLGSLGLMLATVLVMAVAAAAGVAGYGAVAAATMVSGAFWTIDMPVRRQLMIDSIGQERMAAGLGLDNATMYATRTIGPLIGGLTYQFVGIVGIYLVIAAAYVACIAMARRIRVKAPVPHAAPVAASPGLLSRLLPPAELLANRRFQVLMGVTIVYNLWCFPFITMVPVIAAKDFDLPPLLVGAMSACDGIGGTIGALLVGSVVTQRTMFRFHYFGTLVYLVLVAAMSWYLQPGAAVIALLLLGLAAAAFSATQYALTYLTAPPAMRGRATGVLSLCIGASLIGHAHTGFLFERLGSVDAMRLMAVEGLIAIALLGIVWRRAPPSLPAVAARPSTSPANAAK